MNDLVKNEHLSVNGTNNNGGSKSKEIKLKFRLAPDYIYVFSINGNDPDLDVLRSKITPNWVNRVLASNGIEYLDCEGKGIQVLIRNEEGDLDPYGFINHRDFNKEINVEVHGEDIVECAKRGARRIKTPLSLVNAFDE